MALQEGELTDAERDAWRERRDAARRWDCLSWLSNWNLFDAAGAAPEPGAQGGKRQHAGQSPGAATR